MRTNRIVLFLFFLSFAAVSAGQETRELTLEDIFISRKFSEKSLHGLSSMKDGLYYTVAEKGNCISKYSYKTGEAVATLFDGSRFSSLPPFTDYSFSNDEKRILFTCELEPIYRHSFSAGFFIYDFESDTIYPVSKKGKQQLASFSPDGKLVAFVRDNNLFIADPLKGKEQQITFDGIRNRIINGAPDWVYEEEFGFSMGYQWSPDSRRIAFYRFDETGVREFTMMKYEDLYPEPVTYKYPKAGESNSVVSVIIYDLESGKQTVVDTGKETDQYIPRIKWTSDPGVLSVIRLNRLQNHVEILHAAAQDGSSRVVYEEYSKWYISEATDDMITYLDDNEHFILFSERDGYFHFYLYNFRSGDLKLITAGNFDIASYEAYDPENRLLYYSSYEDSPVMKQIYCIRTDGTGKRKISTLPGVDRISFSENFRYYILSHSDANNPQTISLYDHKGKKIRVLEDNNALKEKTKEYRFSPVEFLSVPGADGTPLNAYMIKPPDFDPSRKYPLFMYVYGGPESQNVLDSWSSRSAWFQYLASEGYVIACVDNRGTNGRGEAFRKATYMQLGKLETLDQLAAARWLSELPYIDAGRLGIFGWSYGGFMTSLCMTKGKGLFRMGIAVAPVTSWRYYDTIYTERFMRTPQENPEGYDDNSPINFASGLSGKFLLIHGSGDDNVHFQNSMMFAEQLVQADKQFEMQFYPNKNHGIYGGNTTYHLYTRMTDFILKNL
ncbi:MAG: S9 family peptidase [Bacteroidota bacterium]